MAERRMFSKKVTDDDNFMSLSSAAQALYLHLMMSADDDGFSNQVSISMFKAHASTSDLQALLDRRYVLQFESGVIVLTHWRICNYIQNDRYHGTQFAAEKSQISLDTSNTYKMLDTTCIQDVSKLDTEVRLGKDSIGRVSINNTSQNIQAVLDCYNETCVSLPKAKKATCSRERQIKARLKNYSLDELKALFAKAETIPFLKGENDRGWVANFDWLINEANMTKVLEGVYDNLSKGRQNSSQPKETYAERKEREWEKIQEEFLATSPEESW